MQVFEIGPAGYSSASARSYDSIKQLVKKVYIDSTIAGLGIQNCNYWFNAFSNFTGVRGFKNLSGMTSADQMFFICSSLGTIYDTSFNNSGLSARFSSPAATAWWAGRTATCPRRRAPSPCANSAGEAC
ncbi:hypothetical protein ACTM8Z_06325 [Atopobiaceae bacterium HCP3S3_D6]